MHPTKCIMDLINVSIENRPTHARISEKQDQFVCFTQHLNLT